jgi:hypothetical protein
MSETSTQVTMTILDGVTNPSVNTDLRTDVPYDFDSLRNEHAFAKAAAEDLDIIFPQNDELQIDLDNEHSFILFQNQMHVLQHHEKGISWKVTTSRNGPPGRHVTVQLEWKVTPLERIGLQAILGSDRIRELLGYIRLRRGETHTTLFFERKT